MAIEHKTATLDNGLFLTAEVDLDAHTAACGFFVRTGTRDENPVDMGVSHFLEHMMFKGTETRSAEDVNREFDEVGASNNAFTSQEMTAFYAHVLPEVFPRTLGILADIMRPTLRESDFQDERGVILEEIAMYDDQPFWRLYEKAMEVHYENHPLAMRVLGTVDSIRELKRERMVGYFDQRYSADNTTLAIAGRVDFDDVVERANQFCGRWKRTNTARTYPEVQLESNDFTLEDDRTNRHYLIMISPAPALQDDRRYAASMLANIIGDDEGSILYWALVDPGLAEEAQAGYDGRDALGDMFVYASCSPDRAEQVEEIINDRLDRCLELITEDDLERLRSKTATNITVGSERPLGRMMRLGRLAMYYGEEYRTLDEELARIEAVTLDDLRAVYEAFPFKPRTVGRLRPSNLSAS